MYSLTWNIYIKSQPLIKPFDDYDLQLYIVHMWLYALTVLDENYIGKLYMTDL